MRKNKKGVQSLRACMTAAVAAMALSGAAIAQDNGGSGGVAGPASLTPCSGWQSFSFGALGDVVGPITFNTSAGCTILQVTDDFAAGDEFLVRDFGTPVMRTSITGLGAVSAGPDSAFAQVGYSSGQVILPPGAHSITIELVADCCGGGGAWLQVVECGNTVYDGSVGTAAPPATLGPYDMTPFPADPTATFVDVDGVQAPGGAAVLFDIPMSHRVIGDGWGTWSHGYTGDVYYTNGAADVTMTMPPNTIGFYFYVEPNPFAVIEFEATSNTGTTSGTVAIDGSSGATYFGFYVTSGTLESIKVSTVDGVTDFAVGEFGIARGGIFFDGAPGTAAPPPTIGPSIAMRPFPDDPSPTFTIVDSLVSPCGGEIEFSPALEHRAIGDGWATWSHGYDGDVYFTGFGFGSAPVTITLPTNTKAFYLYVEPENFGVFDFVATSNDGQSSATTAIEGDSGAKYFGFYALGAADLTTITIVNIDGGADGFSIGEFGCARSLCKPIDQAILVYDNNSQHSLAQKGAMCASPGGVTVADAANFNTALALGDWDVVAVDSPGTIPTGGWDPLIAYVNAGNPVVLSYWDWDANPALMAAFDVSLVSSISLDGGGGLTLSAIGGASGIFSGVTMPNSDWHGHWGDDGDTFTPLGGATGLAHVGSPFAPAVVLGNDGCTIAAPVFDEAGDTWLGDGSAVQLWKNMIELTRGCDAPQFCQWDLTGDLVVGPADLAQLLGSWGPCPGCPADFTGDGLVGPPDLAKLLGNWGPCLIIIPL